MFVLVDLPQIAGKEDQMAERAYQLELQLANYSLSPQDRRDPYNLYHMYSLEVEALFSSSLFGLDFEFDSIVSATGDRKLHSHQLYGLFLSFGGSC